MRALMLVTVASLAADCSRAPAEDFPRRTWAAPAPAASSATLAVQAPATVSSAARCVRPTPVQAPPPVPHGPAPGCPPDPEGGPPKVPLVHVAFPDAAGAAVDAELVTSSHDTTRGLMYRTSMPDDHGMLFDLPPREDHAFWMHNTCIPLDLLYVDDDGFIVGIVENAPTLNDSPRSVGCLSRYVLEVNAGWARKHGVKAGQQMTLPTGTK